MRFFRAAWLLLFVIPLSWWAKSGCTFIGVDPLYHTTMWVHERLGWFLIALAITSATLVITKMVIARRRFERLRAVTEPMPTRLRLALTRAAADFRIPVPRMMYVDLAAPIATTVVGRTLVVSRGFLAPLTDAEVDLVMRHEVAHVRYGHAGAGVLWHLAFAALLIPGFEPLERRLHAFRERCANVAAAKGNEDAYLALIARLARGAAMCAGAPLDLEAARRRPGDRWQVWIAPLAVIALAVALPVSHAAFRHDLPYLLSHHC